MINKKFLDEILKRLNIVSESGGATIEQIMINAPQNFNFNELYDYVITQYMPIVETCAENAAIVGASAYDAYRVLEVGEAFEAIPEASFDPELTTSAVRSFVGQAVDARDMSMLVDYLGRRVDSETMRSFTDSQLSNGRRDPLRPRFARVPTGDNVCDFCRALAGHGFYYSSREAAGEFRHYHDYCRCQVVPQFSNKAQQLKVQGYNPDKYVQEWRETRKKFGGSPESETPRITPKSRTSKMPTIETPLLTEKPEPIDLPAKAYNGEWNQVEDMSTFLRTMYDDDEFVGTCSEFYDKDGRRVPTKGLYRRTAGQIENVLDNTNNVSSAVGRYHTADGAYVRINPLDGRGVSDENVTKLKYTLVECDTISPEEQYGFIRALNLPTQTIVTSGKKSVHAVVKIDANDIDEYRERVALLQAECKAAGFDIDTSTKNPSRYMRIPGVKRGNGRQVLVSTNEGANSWDDWRRWCDKQR